MYRVFIWGMGYLYNKYINCVRIHELTGDLKIQCVTSNEKNISTVDGYRFVPKEKIGSVEYDYCVVAVREFQTVLEEALSMGIMPWKCIPIRVFSIPFFDLAKYIEVKKRHISIISRNCWAGLCYNYLGLQFRTPFINMFFSDRDFNKLMRKFDYYLTVPLEFKGMEFDKNLKRQYPVARLDDIYLYLNHYIDYEEAKVCYDRRKQRINKEDLIFISQTTSKSVEEEFCSMPYSRKVIFVPYDSTLESSIRISHTEAEISNGITLGMKANGVANGQNPLFDILSFLMGEKDFLRVREVQER